MNWLDNVIGFFSPETAARRAAWRGYLEEVKSYDAGDHRRGNANWRAVNQSGEFTDRYSRDTVRARARDLERNSDLMNSLISAYVRNVVGKGFILQASTGNEKLNTEIEKLWKVWCKKRNCDVTGTQSLNQMLRMAVRRKKVDGGVLLVKRITRGGVLPLQFQMFEVDELDASQVAPKHKGNRVVGGIEYDSYNRPVGYWIRQYSLDGMSITEPVYIDAQKVIFYFSKRRPSQLREMSDASQTLTRIRDANEFITAVAMKQRIEACFGIGIKRNYPTTGFGRPGAAIPAGPRQTYEGKSIAPGMILEMNPGDELQQINPQGQASDASAFLKLLQRMIGAGQGLSYESTSRDMSQSTYSSARQGLIEDGMTYGEEEELLLEVMDEIYESFLISAVLAEAIPLSASEFWNNKDDYFRHSFEKPPKGWIDPSKEATAVKIALQTGQKTFKQIAAENGSDWHKQIDDICEVLEYAREEHGIDLGGVILGQKKSDGLYDDEDEPPAPGPDAPAGSVPATLEPGAAGEQPNAPEGGGTGKE